MVLLDATAFSFLVNPDSKAPTNPLTLQPVVDAPTRFHFLREQIEKAGSTILIPTPALAEVLVAIGDAGPAILELLNGSARFKIADFDQKAAIELAAMTREAIRSGGKKGSSQQTSQKVKFDRQIIAIARTNQVERIYSDDGGVKHFAELIGMQVIQTWEMPLPPEVAQGTLFEGEPTNEPG